jgi:hypothetical protein
MQIHPHRFDFPPRPAHSSREEAMLFTAAPVTNRPVSDSDAMLIGGDFGLPFPAGQHPGSARAPKPVKLVINYALAIVLVSWVVMFWPLVALLTATNV